jgi:anti-anti-sigma regulatory factor
MDHQKMDAFLQTDDSGFRQLRYSGSIDIFDAEPIYADVVDAVNDPAVRSIQVDLADAIRLDATAAQIMIALQKAGQERSIEIAFHLNPEVESKLKMVGIVL